MLAGGLSFQLSTGGLRDALGGRADEPAAATFVGSETCAGCHRAEADLWRGSQHKHAMDHATEKSVARRFFRRELRLLRRALALLPQGRQVPGRDRRSRRQARHVRGEIHIRPRSAAAISHRVSGWTCSRLCRWPGTAGRRTKAASAGSISIPNEEIKHDDILHWTKLNQNWNFMCAECHSTGVRKNYDAAKDRFATSFAEISVGCEACHGQGSRHVGWARAQQSWWPFGKNEDPRKGLLVRFDERRDITWPINARTGNAARSFTPALVAQGGRDLRPVPRAPRRVFRGVGSRAARCRIRTSSRRSAAGSITPMARCSTRSTITARSSRAGCSRPASPAATATSRTARSLRAPGDAVCLQCHAADKFTVDRTTVTTAATPPPACASCHMPTRTYMVVDRRHDHSFRVPRPDLSVRLGTPNACNDCHGDKSAAWAASAIEGWHGATRKGFQTYAEAFHAAWTRQAEAAALLAVVAADRNAPAFARTGALSELGARLSPSSINLARTALSDPDPMVRIGGLDMLQSVPAAQLWPLVSPLLSDSSRGVRIRAAALLASVPTASQPAADRERFERAAAEFIAAQRLNADRPEARSDVGEFPGAPRSAGRSRGGIQGRATAQPAICARGDQSRRSLSATGAGCRRRDRVARRDARVPARRRSPLCARTCAHSAQAARRRPGELRRATELEPDRARYAYVYAVALHSAGRGAEAVSVLKEALDRHPADRDILLALVNYNRDAGDIAGALAYAEQLARLAPDDRSDRRGRPGASRSSKEARRTVGPVTGGSSSVTGAPTRTAASGHPAGAAGRCRALLR